MGRNVIWDLMDLFWEAVEDAPNDTMEFKKSFRGKSYQLLSNNYRKTFEMAVEDGRRPVEYAQLQLVTDYIAGMTDNYAASLHEQLMNG